MVFIACGLNHKSAPLAVREKIAMPTAMQAEFLHRLLDWPEIDEAAILSTCNRTEIYCVTETPEILLPWLAHEHQLDVEELKPYLYVHPEHQGIRHVLRVASGLDSMMLGEPQIFGQMKQTYQLACQAGTVKQNLRSIFEYIFSASKRIRSRSAIGVNPVSIAYAAVLLIGQTFRKKSDLRVFIIGSGETANLVAKYLYEEGVKDFLIASRTAENAQKLAHQFNGKSLDIGDIPHFLPEADIVISATACPLPFINKSLVEDALIKRNHSPMLFLDLAVPRDVEADVAELENIQLINIDDLQAIVDQGMEERRCKAEEAERLVEEELENYIRWHRSLLAKNIICQYREAMQDTAQKELNRALAKLPHHSAAQVVEELCERLVNKLIHVPTTGLKQVAWDNRQDLLELAQYLFNTAINNYSYEEIT